MPPWPPEKKKTNHQGKICPVMRAQAMHTWLLFHPVEGANYRRVDAQADSRSRMNFTKTNTHPLSCSIAPEYLLGVRVNVRMHASSLFTISIYWNLHKHQRA